MVGVRRPDAELPCRFRADVVVAHQLGNGVDAAGVTASDKLLVDAWAAITGLDLGVDGSNFHEESVVPLFLRAAGALPPGVVAGGGNLQRFTEQTDGPLV